MTLPPLHQTTAGADRAAAHRADPRERIGGMSGRHKAKARPEIGPPFGLTGPVGLMTCAAKCAAPGPNDTGGGLRPARQ